jgi:uncharacterized protein
MIRTALVTGASAGLGAEFSRQLAARRVDLVLVARRQAALDALASELGVAHGVTCEVLPADLTEPAGVDAVANRLADDARPVDLLVNNAGFGLYGPFAEIDRGRQETMVDLNVRAVVTLAHAALPGMLARDRGAVLNVASTAAFQPDPYGAVYGASKAFVRSFSEALHEEVRGTGVRVLVSCPGFTDTEFQQVAGIDQRAMPEAVAMQAGPVVAAALEDLRRGRAVSVPGWQNKVSAWGSELSPSALTRRVSGRIHAAWTSR